MTFLILYPLDRTDENFRYFKGMFIADLSAVNRVRSEHPEAFVVEQIDSMSPKNALPGELARAVDAWNAMPKEVTVPRLRGSLARFVAPYRKWKKEAGQRDYLLEQLVADVVASPFCWSWIRFSWLFGKKNGELNSEKLRGEAARGGWKNGAANGEMTSADYIRLSGRVAQWMRSYGEMTVGGSDEEFERAFEAGIGVSWLKYLELRRQFNGGAPE